MSVTGTPQESRYPHSHVPVATGACFGRAEALEEVLRLLERPECRLVTLTGAPGIGKTRLALSLAEQAPQRLRCPAIWVSLRDLTDPDALADTLAAALELPATSTEEPRTRLLHHAAHLQVLFVLDNFEHLLPPAAPADAARQLLADLLAAAPLLNCLVTSRVPLSAAGEWVYRVPPLALPPSDDGPHSPDVLPQKETSGYPSVQLFVERAQAANPDWKLTEQNAAAVGRLCRHLDGLPLAIELAAAQVRAFTVEEICRQWEAAAGDRLALLEDSAERNLRRSLELWFGRLSATAKQVLADLSLCIGDFTLDTVTAISGATAQSPVRELVEANWLQKREVEGQSRYSLLEPIRVFAETKRAADSPAERRHAERFYRSRRLPPPLGQRPAAGGTASDRPRLAQPAARLSLGMRARGRCRDRRLRTGPRPFPDASRLVVGTCGLGRGVAGRGGARR